MTFQSERKQLPIEDLQFIGQCLIKENHVHIIARLNKTVARSSLSTPQLLSMIALCVIFDFER